MFPTGFAVGRRPQDLEDPFDLQQRNQQIIVVRGRGSAGRPYAATKRAAAAPSSLSSTPQKLPIALARSQVTQSNCASSQSITATTRSPVNSTLPGK